VLVPSRLNDLVTEIFVMFLGVYRRVYPKVSGLAAWSENCN